MKLSTFIFLLSFSFIALATDPVKVSQENDQYSAELNKACEKEIYAWANSNLIFDKETSDEDLERIEIVEKEMYSCIENFNKPS